MQDYVPFIRKEEETRIQSEIDGQQLSVIFDSTSCLGEALAVILRLVYRDWSMQQILSKSLAEEKLMCNER